MPNTFTAQKSSVLIVSLNNGDSVGDEFEFVPLKDAAEFKAGDEMTVQVPFHGAPRPDLQVEASWAGAADRENFIVGRTDKSGRITAKLTSPGKWRFHTVLMEHCRTQVADWELGQFNVRNSLRCRFRPAPQVEASISITLLKLELSGSDRSFSASGGVFKQSFANPFAIRRDCG